MRNAARIASFIVFASVACVMVQNARAQQPSTPGVNFYSPEREAMEGAASAATLERSLTVIRSEALETYFSQLVGDQKYRVVVFHQPTGNVDAGQVAMPTDGFASGDREPVALPGTIFLSDRLLAESMDEAELAKKIAHAMAHVSLRHATKLATKAELAQYTQLPMLFMGNGWAGYGVRQAAQVQIPLAFQRFAKQYEAEADKASTEILAGFSPDAAGFARAQGAVR